MDRHPGRLLVVALALLCASCQDNRSELEKAMYPDGTPPGVTFEPATQGSGIDADPPNTAGKGFLRQLVSAIEESDRVVAVEHSYLYDGSDLNKHFLPERSYRSVVLTDADRARLAVALSSTNSHVSMWAAACIFEPHHRLEFYTKSNKTRTLEICFQCAQLEWEGQQASAPQAIYGTLERFVESVGMQPERDWTALARSRP